MILLHCYYPTKNISSNNNCFAGTSSSTISPQYRLFPSNNPIQKPKLPMSNFERHMSQWEVDFRTQLVPSPSFWTPLPYCYSKEYFDSLRSGSYPCGEQPPFGNQSFMPFSKWNVGEDRRGLEALEFYRKLVAKSKSLSSTHSLYRTRGKYYAKILCWTFFSCFKYRLNLRVGLFWCICKF